jgi:hypothetical protein
LTLALIAGCSDEQSPSDDGGGGAGGEAASGNYWCTCVDGPSVQVDAPPDAQCASLCDDLGGVASVEPVVTAVGTEECQAFCAKADGLGCPGDSCKAKEDFWCTAPVGQCLEALQAQLQCETEMGTFSCDDDSWQMSAPCGTFDELCADS